MSPDHLVRHVVQHVAKRELPGLFGDRGLQEDMEEEIPQFPLQLIYPPVRDGLYDLVGLLDQALPE